MAVMCERGLESCPLTVCHLEVKAPAPTSVKDSTVTNSQNNVKDKTDYETLADMHKRRQNERARLIAEMLRTDGVDP